MLSFFFFFVLPQTYNSTVMLSYEDSAPMSQQIQAPRGVRVSKDVRRCEQRNWVLRNILRPLSNNKHWTRCNDVCCCGESNSMRLLRSCARVSHVTAKGQQNSGSARDNGFLFPSLCCLSRFPKGYGVIAIYFCSVWAARIFIPPYCTYRNAFISLFCFWICGG